MELNYENDIRIDENSLDIEWLEQANLAMEYGKNYARCRRVLTKASEKVKIVRAACIKEANENPGECCGKSKPNAADIEAYYRSQDSHKEAKKEWVDAQYELDMAEVAKNEISFTRKAALENLVKLHGQQYFAGPSMPRDINLEAKKRRDQKQSDSEVASKMRRRRK
jgi:hypothetical protein